MEEQNTDIRKHSHWSEKYSDKAFNLMKQSFIVFVVIISLNILLFPAEYLLLLSFIAFLYTLLVGVTSLIGLVFRETKRKFYIQTALSIVVSLSLIFIHLYIGHKIVEGHKRSLLVAKRIVCNSNLRQICFYCSSNIVEKRSWCDDLRTHIEDSNEFKCTIDNTGPCSYAMNENIPDDANDFPDDLVLLFESTPGWNQTGGPDDVVTDRHKESGANIGFADGRVEFIKPEDIPNLRWTVEE